MATKRIGNVVFDESVDTTSLDTSSPADPAFVAAVNGPRKVRVTVWLDGDVIDELKRRAPAEAEGKYQTLLNRELRRALVEPTVIQVVSRPSSDAPGFHQTLTVVPAAGAAPLPYVLRTGT